MATSSCTETRVREPLSLPTFCTPTPLAALDEPVSALRKLAPQRQGSIQAASNPPCGSSLPTAQRLNSEQTTGGVCCGKATMSQDEFMTVTSYAGSNRDNNTCRARCAKSFSSSRGGFAARIQSRPVAQPYLRLGQCGSTQLQNPASLPGARLM